ncbi:MAG: type II secretion system GspH family protein [Ruminococcus sp.]|nr:type II secretion system GspH family protein [Ruminococcus sp.]
MKERLLKGFTIIELIVVMAIIGIMMAILIPNLISYINESRLAVANVNANTVYKCASNWLTKAQIAGVPFPESTRLFAGTPCSVGYPEGGSVNENFAEMDTPEEINAAFRASMDTLLQDLEDSSCFCVMVDNSGNVLQTFWSTDVENRVVGGFPNTRTTSELGEDKNLPALVSSFGQG